MLTVIVGNGHCGNIITRVQNVQCGITCRQRKGELKLLSLFLNQVIHKKESKALFWVVLVEGEGGDGSDEITVYTDEGKKKQLA